MESIIKLIAGTACCAALLTAGAAQAHYLWLEPDDSGAKLYYGEAEALLKEKSPGKLDNILTPKAFVPDASTGKPIAVAVSRNATHFAIAANKNAPVILATEESLEVRDLTKSGLGFAKSNYYARLGQQGNNADGVSPLVLDVRAQGEGPNVLTLLYRGQPLAETKLEVIAPNTWVQEHKTNAQGKADINMPWRGQYVVHVLHIDKTPGQFADKKYDTLRNHLTYTFVKQDGADPGPAVPPKHGMD